MDLDTATDWAELICTGGIGNKPPKSAVGQKFDAGKPRWGLLMQGCPNALRGAVDVLTFGAGKYTPGGWRHVPDATNRYVDALYRHLHAYDTGELIDPESGLPHIHHALCNILFLAELGHEQE